MTHKTKMIDGKMISIHPHCQLIAKYFAIHRSDIKLARLQRDTVPGVINKPNGGYLLYQNYAAYSRLSEMPKVPVQLLKNDKSGGELMLAAYQELIDLFCSLDALNPKIAECLCEMPVDVAKAIFNKPATFSVITALREQSYDDLKNARKSHKKQLTQNTVHTAISNTIKATAKELARDKHE